MNTLSLYKSPKRGLAAMLMLVAALAIMGVSTTSHAHNVGFLTMGIRLHEGSNHGHQGSDALANEATSNIIPQAENAAQENAPEAYMPNAGIAEVEHTATEDHGTLDLAIWYPASKMPQTLTIGRWHIQGARNAAPSEGQFPLVIISHDAGEMRLHHHRLANFLAQNGFVVAALTHPHDCNVNMSAMFTLQQLVHRPQHVQLLVDKLLENPKTSAMIDAQHIAFIGFGVGATTGLTLAGGVPSPREWPDYCAEAKPSDIYCSTWAKKRLDNMVLALEDALYIPEKNEKNQSNADSQASPLYPKMPKLRDKRITSFALVTPAYGMFFPASALQGVTAPILLVQAEHDAINPKPFHAEALRVALPTTPEFFLLKEAGHFSLRDMPRLAPRHGSVRDMPRLAPWHGEVHHMGDEDNIESLEPTLSPEEKQATQHYVHERILNFLRNSLRL